MMHLKEIADGMCGQTAPTVGVMRSVATRKAEGTGLISAWREF